MVIEGRIIMTKKIRVVDLSLEIKEGPGVLGAKIEYLDHKGSVPQMITSWKS
jgi:hypothetical protein